MRAADVRGFLCAEQAACLLAHCLLVVEAHCLNERVGCGELLASRRTRIILAYRTARAAALKLIELSGGNTLANVKTQP